MATSYYGGGYGGPRGTRDRDPFSFTEPPSSARHSRAFVQAQRVSRYHDKPHPDLPEAQAPKVPRDFKYSLQVGTRVASAEGHVKFEPGVGRMNGRYVAVIRKYEVSGLTGFNPVEVGGRSEVREFYVPPVKMDYFHREIILNGPGEGKARRKIESFLRTIVQYQGPTLATLEKSGAGKMAKSRKASHLRQAERRGTARASSSRSGSGYRPSWRR